MLKKIITMAIGLLGVSKASAEPVKAFLDKEQRPGATVVTESFVEFSYDGKAINVEGVLGAIESERRPGSFVAFSGVELKAEVITSSLGEEPHLAIELSEVSNVSTLTVQLVLTGGDLFAVDLDLTGESSSLSLRPSLKSFKESFRGRMGEKSFDGNFSDLKAVRIFLKRSENLPKEKKAIKFSFVLENLNFKD